jgi:hypothetical protein
MRIFIDEVLSRRDILQPGNWDGNGNFDLGVFRPFSSFLLRNVKFLAEIWAGKQKDALHSVSKLLIL